MSRDSESRRAWIKNVAIIFLVVLLLLTFFSNTILNYTLPEVSAQYARYGTITTSVKLNGTVKANESYNVQYEAEQAEAENGTVQSRKVISVYVKEGDTVSVDTPIISLQGGASEQLKAAQEEYDKLKREYDLALLEDTVTGLTSSKTISDAEQKIVDQKKALAELKEDYNAVINGVDNTSVIEARIEALEEEIEDLTDVVNAQKEKITEIEGKIKTAEGMIEEDILSTLTVTEKLAIAEDEYTSIEASYNTLSAEVKELKAVLDKIQSSSGDIDKANTLTNEIKTLEESLDKLELERKRYVEDYKRQYDSSISSYEKLEETYENAKAEYYKYEKQYGDEIDLLESYSLDYQNKSTAYNRLLNNKEAYESAVEKYEDAKLRYQTALSNKVDYDSEQLLKATMDEREVAMNGAKVDCPTPEELDRAKAEMNTAGELYSMVQGYAEALSSLQLDMEKAEKAMNSYSQDSSDITIDSTTYNRKLEDYDSQISDLERQISDAYEKLDVIGLPTVDDVVDYTVTYDLAEAQRKYDDANAELTEITKKYEEAKTKVESLRKQSTAEGTVSEYTLLLEKYEADLDSLEAQLKQKNKDLEAKKKELSKTETPADPDDILKQIETAESTVKDLEAQLEITKATETKSDKTTEFEREDQLKKLEELQAKIEEYKNAPENTDVKAPIAGRVVSVDVVPGDTVTSGQTVARIEIADKGYICEVSMSAEESRKVQVGAECSISNSWWYSDIKATVSQIRSDAQSQGKNRIVVITVTGDSVYEGQSLSFTVGDKNQSYDCVLPNSAIREDNDGKFVLTVTSKKTPLGVRYTAVRTNIEVIASDDTNSAVSGLYGSEFVITNSTSPISDRQQVRLTDENG